MTITSNGSYDFVTCPGKEYVFRASGTFGSGTVTLLWVEGSSTGAIEDFNGPISYTSNGATQFRAPSNTVRVTLAGSSNPSIELAVFGVCNRCR